MVLPSSSLRRTLHSLLTHHELISDHCFVRKVGDWVERYPVITRLLECSIYRVFNNWISIDFIQESCTNGSVFIINRAFPVKNDGKAVESSCEPCVEERRILQLNSHTHEPRRGGAEVLQQEINHRNTVEKTTSRIWNKKEGQ